MHVGNYIQDCSSFVEENCIVHLIIHIQEELLQITNMVFESEKNLENLPQGRKNIQPKYNRVFFFFLFGCLDYKI